MKSTSIIFTVLLLLTRVVYGMEIVDSPKAGTVAIVSGESISDVIVDPKDYPVVQLSAKMLADDIERVSGKRPQVLNQPGKNPLVIIAGTLGHSEVIDKLVADGKIQDIKKIEGVWETTLCQIVEQPSPDVDRALVIIGSDRRGTAYGLLQLSQKIGVSPWYWWADVPPMERKTLIIDCPQPEIDSPGVKYRGIFINDEDWGLHQWAKNTFEPEVGGIGPKTYEKVFELMLRLRLNYLWPAMHACSPEFQSFPENIELADRYGIVMGASHCEPMLYNNVKWDINQLGKWDYSINHDKIYSTWEDSAKLRGQNEAVWTIGIRGIHDQGMQGPKDTPTRIQILNNVFKDQRSLLDQYVSKQWGQVSQCFVPYKEVLPLYDAGLNVPDDVTIVWVDDNFGYIRRLSAPQERKRTGGAGVYWHLSYYGNPHSYTWINTTAPALMWEEFHKAWANDARRLWVINVGDIKPMEIGIDYYSKLAWNPEAVGSDSQPTFLKSFAEQHFGTSAAQPIADLLGKYYRLGTIRKPELMNREWAMSLPSDQAAQLRHDYDELLAEESKISETIPAASRDAYFELIGFPARVLCATGSIFMSDRAIQSGENIKDNQESIARQRAILEKLVEQYNTAIAGGKWKSVMPGLETGKLLTSWSSQVRWPWGESTTSPTTRPVQPNRSWRDAASADKQSPGSMAQWKRVDGLGTSSRAMIVDPPTLESAWQPGDSTAPTLEYDFATKSEAGQILIDFLPTFRIYPGMQQRVAVRIDDQPFAAIEVPGSSGKEDENGPNRRNGIQNNYVRATFTFDKLTPGDHKLTIQPIDPGVAIDKIAFPSNP